MKKNKKKVIGIIIILAAVIFGIIYYNNSRIISSAKKTDSYEINAESIDNDSTENINKYLNNAEIISVGLDIYGEKNKRTVPTRDKDKIESIVKYLKNIKFDVTDTKPNSDICDAVIYLSDKNEKTYRIELYGNIAEMYINNESLGEFYNFVGYNSDDLIKLCDEVGLEEY